MFELDPKDRARDNPRALSNVQFQVQGITDDDWRFYKRVAIAMGDVCPKSGGGNCGSSFHAQTCSVQNAGRSKRLGLSNSETAVPSAVGSVAPRPVVTATFLKRLVALRTASTSVCA